MARRQWAGWALCEVCGGGGGGGRHWQCWGTSLKWGKDHVCEERGRHRKGATPYLRGRWGALLWASLPHTTKTPGVFPVSWGRSNYTHFPDEESAQLLVQPLWKTVWSFLRKLKIEPPSSQQSYSWAYTQRNSNSKRYMHSCVQSSTVHNSQDMERTSIFINRWMDKADVEHTYSGILFSIKKESHLQQHGCN